MKEKLKILLTSENVSDRVLALNMLKTEDKNLYHFLTKLEIKINIENEYINTFDKNEIEFVLKMYEEVIKPKKLFYGQVVKTPLFNDISVVIIGYTLRKTSIKLLDLTITDCFINVMWFDKNININTDTIATSFFFKND